MAPPESVRSWGGPVARGCPHHGSPGTTGSVSDRPGRYGWWPCSWAWRPLQLPHRLPLQPAGGHCCAPGARGGPGWPVRGLQLAGCPGGSGQAGGVSRAALALAGAAAERQCWAPVLGRRRGRGASGGRGNLGNVGKPGRNLGRFAQCTSPAAQRIPAKVGNLAVSRVLTSNTPYLVPVY